MVKYLVSIDKIKGKKVIAKNGMMIGKVEDVEMDDTTWAVKTVDVKLEDNVAKLFGEKTFMKKNIVPLPGHLMGPITEDTIYLNEKVADIPSLIAQIETKRAIL
jgi:sporulation protein YlmC with PRC-barrel domain